MAARVATIPVLQQAGPRVAAVVLGGVVIEALDGSISAFVEISEVAPEIPSNRLTPVVADLRGVVVGTERVTTSDDKTDRRWL